MTMTIDKQVQALLKQAAGFAAAGDARLGVCAHSDEVGAGDIFVAAGGAVEFIEVALGKGAALVVYDADDDARVRACGVAGHARVVAVAQFTDVVSALLAEVYQAVLHSVALIGVTGTNGKTSTASFIGRLLHGLAKPTGYIGTLGYGVVGEPMLPTRNTTPDRVSLYRYIAALYRRGCGYVVVEVSSHGIALGRIAGLSFCAAVFTNLSREHLDFHGSMQAYAATKRSYFNDYSIQRVVANADDRVGRAILQQWDGAAIGFSNRRAAKQRAATLFYDCQGIDSDGLSGLLVDYADVRLKITSRLFGRFNSENLVAAIGVCLALGHELAAIAEVVPMLSAVAGRLEHIRVGDVAALIDYAHTPKAVESVLGDSSVVAKHAWCVLGCGGDRDRGKRAAMAHIAASMAGRLVICDDNVRGDDATQIVLDMLAGIQHKQGVIVCRDRKQAIATALAAAGGGNVFILGKGDEATMDYGVAKIAQRDRDVVLQLGGGDGH